MTDPYARHDAALDALRPYGPNLANGYINHAPMVVEVLAAMGLGHAALGWLKSQEAQFLPRGEARVPIEAGAWREALGRRERYEDWTEFFAREIETQGWPVMLDRWVARLAKGYASAAVHGLLRTAHAARALARQDSPARRDELARGLAVWAAMYTPLPVSPAGLGFGDLAPDAALAALAPVPARYRVSGGSITRGLDNLAHAKDFTEAVARADLSGDPFRVADVLVSTFADLFLDAARTEYGAVVFTHAVTGAAAARTLVALTGPKAQRSVLAGAWQSGCALKTVFYPDPDLPERQPRAVPTPAGLAAAALTHGDDHAIKLTEACLSAHARTGKRALLRAAALGQALLSPQTSPPASAIHASDAPRERTAAGTL